MSDTINSDTPKFITQEYIENILKNYFQDSTLQVTEINASPASAKGESYCSVMTRLRVKYKVKRSADSKQITFLVKSTEDNDSISTSILKKYDVYNTEMEMYETVFPQLHQLLRAIGDKEQLSAETIYVDRQLNAIMCEDLSIRQFITADRLVGMDEAHVKICLRKLGKMHAAAAVLNERQGGCLERFTYGIFNRHVNYFGVFFENVIGVCAKFAETCPELGAYYREKLLKLIPYAVEYATRCSDPNPKHFLTLNHGDLWTNNVMIQYHKEENDNVRLVKDALLIDFQYCNWTSPAVDLHYFFCTSLQDDLLFNQQPKLVQYYHQVLSETLEKLKYKQHIPTLLELQIQLMERGFYGMYIRK